MTEPEASTRLAVMVADAAVREDPSLPEAAGRELALAALAELRLHPAMTPGALARALLVQHPGTDVSWVNHVSRLALLLATRR